MSFSLFLKIQGAENKTVNEIQVIAKREKEHVIEANDSYLSQSHLLIVLSETFSLIDIFLKRKNSSQKDYFIGAFERYNIDAFLAAFTLELLENPGLAFTGFMEIKEMLQKITKISFDIELDNSKI